MGITTQQRERVTAQRLVIVMIDPVCGVDLRASGRAGWRFAQAAETTVHDGKHYFFCSRECRKEFDQSPRKYLQAS